MFKTVMFRGPGEATLMISPQRPEPSSLITQFHESPTGDLDDILSCYIHSPMSDSVLNSPDDMLLRIPQAFQDALWNSYIINQDSPVFNNSSVAVMQQNTREEKGTSRRPKRLLMSDDVDEVDDICAMSDDGFSSSEEFPSRSSDPYITGYNPYFGDTEAPDVGVLSRKCQNRGKGLHKLKSSGYSEATPPRLTNKDTGIELVNHAGALE